MSEIRREINKNEETLRQTIEEIEKLRSSIEAVGSSVATETFLRIAALEQKKQYLEDRLKKLREEEQRLKSEYERKYPHLKREALHLLKTIYSRAEKLVESIDHVINEITQLHDLSRELEVKVVEYENARQLLQKSDSSLPRGLPLPDWGVVNRLSYQIARLKEWVDLWKEKVKE